MNREQWLTDLAGQMGPWYPEMPPIRVSVGFPSKGARSKSIGECWSPKCSEDGAAHVFIHPGQSDAGSVAAILAHELIHASIGCEKKHGAEFKRVALGLGLEGPMRATTPGPVFVAKVAPLLAAVGPYPHAKLSAGLTSRSPTQTTRMVKVECACGYLVRLTRKWLDVAVPSCPVCEVEMREG